MSSCKKCGEKYANNLINIMMKSQTKDVQKKFGLSDNNVTRLLKNVKRKKRDETPSFFQGLEEDEDDYDGDDDERE